jgi:hypothetical protein
MAGGFSSAFSSSGRLRTNVGLGPRFSTRGGLNFIPSDLMAGGFSSVFSSSARLKTNVGPGPRGANGAAGHFGKVVHLSTGIDLL